MQKDYDAIVVGAGVIGAMIAYELTEHGMKVALIDRSAPGSETSWVSLGGLVGGSAEEPSPNIVELLITSGLMYDDLAPKLFQETQIDIECVNRGTICVAFDDFDIQNMNDQYEKQIHLKIPNLIVEKMTGEQTRQIEPGISKDVIGALYYPNDGQVNNIRLVQACIKGSLLRGADLFDGTTVEALIINSNFVQGVQLSSGESLNGRWVINSAGAWSDTINGMPPTGIMPSKGQTLSLRAHSRETMFRHVIMSPGQFVVPRPDGEVRVGSTFEFVGFDKRVTTRALIELLSGAVRIIPALSECAFIEARVGFRPCSKDFLPIVGSSTKLKGLLYATGHHKFGITLAPMTAKIIRSICLGERIPEFHKLMDPSRIEI